MFILTALLMFILSATCYRLFTFPNIYMHPKIAGVIFYHISQYAKNKHINMWIMLNNVIFLL